MKFAGNFRKNKLYRMVENSRSVMFERNGIYPTQCQIMTVWGPGSCEISTRGHAASSMEQLVI